MAETLAQIYEAMTETEQKELYDFALFLRAKNSLAQSAPQKKSCFGALKDKIAYIAPDFDAPVADFAEYM